MKIIQVQDGDMITGFNELIDCKSKGEFAIWQITDELINTTDDVPSNFKDMKWEDIINIIQQAAAKRRFELRAAKLEIYGDNLAEKVIQHDYEEDQSSKKM